MISTTGTTTATVLDAPRTIDPTLDSDSAAPSSIAAVRERLVRRAHKLTFGVPMLLVLTVVLRGYLHPQVEDDEGASTAEWVIGVAIAATLAIAVGAIIVAKVTAKATSIDLG